MPMIEISDDAMSYMGTLAKPFEDTTVSVFDRIVAEHRELKGDRRVADKEPEMRFGSEDFPSVQFTTVTSGKVAGKPVSQKYWNNILSDMIAACVRSAGSSRKVQNRLIGNTVAGRKSDNGYRYVPEADFSFQGMEAKRACKNIALLAEAFDVSVDISFRWQDNEKAQFPNRIARIVLP